MKTIQIDNWTFNHIKRVGSVFGFTFEEYLSQMLEGSIRADIECDDDVLTDEDTNKKNETYQG